MKIGWKLWADEVVSAWTVWGEPGTVYVEYAPPGGVPHVELALTPEDYLKLRHRRDAVVITLPAGTVVESQDGRRLRGRVVGDGHPLSGWVWVAWQEYGTYDELIEDLTIIAP